MLRIVGGGTLTSDLPTERCRNYCLVPGELRLTLHPGVGLADGGIPVDVSMDRVPFDLRMPNTRVWVRFDETRQVQEVWRREQ